MVCQKIQKNNLNLAPPPDGALDGRLGHLWLGAALRSWFQCEHVQVF